MKNDVAFHATARFGLGAKTGELQQIAGDPRGWLLEQLSSPIIPPEVQQRFGGEELIGQLKQYRKNKELEKAKEINQQIREVYAAETGIRMQTQMRSNQPLIERLVMFWSNHFTVSISKEILVGLVNQYEVEAIRPYIGGYFKDMLLAVCHHPAMIIYLDNASSFGTNIRSPVKNKGLNENLAREVMELHTLGVDGGYTQADVIALAKIITGWSLDGKNGTEILKYKFRPMVHELGDKTLLGKTFRQNGELEGIEALTMLAEHPATAKHIATKLVSHFVADKPPENAVNKITRSFMNSGGHLPTVMASVIALEEAWNNPLAKFKTMYEYAISGLRLLEPDVEAKKLVMVLAAQLGYRPFAATSPAGYDDITEAWLSSDGLMKRIEFSKWLAVRMPANTNPMQLASAAFGDAESTTTKQTIENAASGRDGIGLLLSSPEFQRR